MTFERKGGFYDLAEIARHLDSIGRRPSIKICRALVEGAHNVVERVCSIGASAALPGSKQRNACRRGLAYHTEMLKKALDHTAGYDKAADLKQYVIQAYVEANSIAAAGVAV